MSPECDGCGTTEYDDTNPFVEVRTPRPSDRTDMCCIMWGCRNCFPGTRTPEEWTDWIEGEGMREGYMWLS